MQQDIELLGMLGYDRNNKMTEVLSYIVSEVEDAMDDYENDDIEKLIKDKNSYIYVEPACFGYEIGLNNLHRELAKLHNDRKTSDVDENLFNNIFIKNHNLTIEDTIFKVAEYKKNLEKIETKTIVIKQKIRTTAN